jgi:hypothetical protein
MEIIKEGRYDEITTELSRKAVEKIKKREKRLNLLIRLFERTPIDVSFYIRYSDEIIPQVYGGTYLEPKKVRKGLKNKRIVIHVDLPKTEELINKVMSSIIPDLKGIIRHEIEHVAQHKFKDRERKGFFSKKRRYPEDILYWEYLVEPYEVEAYVRGLYKKSKTSKTGLKDVIDSWINEYLINNENPLSKLDIDEIEHIRKAWYDYANKHLPKNEFRKYGFSYDSVNENNILNVSLDSKDEKKFFNILEDLDVIKFDILKKNNEVCDIKILFNESSTKEDFIIKLVMDEIKINFI